MTRRVSKAEKDKVVSLLAQYLEGRSEVFQNKVYELVIRYGWDVNDPSFAILLATGQMETILESFPEQFEALFLRLMHESQQAFIRYQQLFEVQQSQFKDYVQGLEVQQSQSMALLQENIQAVNQGMETQHKAAVQTLNQILKVAQARRDEIAKEVKDDLASVERQFIQSAANHARKLIEEAGTVWKRKALNEIIWLAGSIGCILFMAGFGVGIFANQAYVNRFSENLWANQLWVWNQVNFRECVKVGKTTCNFRLGPPK
jgi:Fe2+ transport system protein B